MFAGHGSNEERTRRDSYTVRLDAACKCSLGNPRLLPSSRPAHRSHVPLPRAPNRSPRRAAPVRLASAACAPFTATKMLPAAARSSASAGCPRLGCSAGLDWQPPAQLLGSDRLHIKDAAYRVHVRSARPYPARNSPDTPILCFFASPLLVRPSHARSSILCPSRQVAPSSGPHDCRPL